MTSTVTTTQSYGSRVTGAFKGILIGLLLVAVGPIDQERIVQSLKIVKDRPAAGTAAHDGDPPSFGLGKVHLVLSRLISQ